MPSKYICSGLHLSGKDKEIIMTKRFLKVLGISACMAAAFSISAFAAEITSVSFAAGADADASLSAGNTDPVFVVNDTNAEYELSSYSSTSNTDSFKTARTYELTFEANSGFTFPSANSITVTGKGITEITKKTVDDDTTLVVKVKAYPYHMWEAPDDINVTNNSAGKPTKITWNKNGASTSEYILKYVNTSGETKYVHGTTSSGSFSVPAAVRSTVTDKQKENDDKQDAEYEGFTVRVKGNAGSNPYTAPSEWAGDTGIVDEYSDGEIESYETWGDLFEGVNGMSGGSSSNSGSSSANNGSKGPGGTLNGWVGSAEKWYYYQNGTAVKGWYNDNGTWYYLNPVTGLMQTGWVIDNSKRYYLNPNHGGPLGAMLTGTHVIDGQTYNFAASGEVM